MSPKDFIRITEHDHIWLSELPAIPKLAAEQEHAYVVPWELAPRDVMTVNASVVFDDEARRARSLSNTPTPPKAASRRWRP